MYAYLVEKTPLSDDQPPIKFAITSTLPPEKMEVDEVRGDYHIRIKLMITTNL